MKKRVILIFITIIIAISFIVIFITIKNSMRTKYSHNDIVNLLNKGLQSMDNISFDRTNTYAVVTYYYKDGKMKMVPHSSSLFAIEKDNKTYMIDKEKKMMVIKPGYTIGANDVIDGSNQYRALDIERFNNKLDSEDNFRYEFVYIKDEKIEDKDCIFVKETKYYTDTKKYVNNVDYENRTPVWWIEKNSGLVIAAALMESGKNETAPEAIISNIKYGEVTDDIFNDMENIPSDYQIIVNENGEIKRIQ